jgi:hypothetical protein
LWNSNFDQDKEKELPQDEIAATGNKRGRHAQLWELSQIEGDENYLQ